MKKTTLTAVLLSLSLALPAAAKEVSGVNLPDTVTVDGKELKLNGAGLRSKFVFKVYVAALYLENTTRESVTAINSDQVKRVRMVMLRDLEKGKIVEAMQEGVEKNNKDKMPALKDRLERFTAAIPDLKKGDDILVTYVPGQGTSVQTKSGAATRVEGKDFADALFSVWLGKQPVDDGLRDGMMGRNK
jgi:hypothetical protein